MEIEVALLLYNRPEHSKAVIQSLLADGLQRLRVFMDFPDKEEVKVNQEKMLAFLDTVHRDLDVTLHRHSEKQGLAKSVRFAMNTCFSDSDAVVLLEDDCVLRPGGLTFFFEGLTRLRSNSCIRSLSGYSYPCNFVFGENDKLLLLNRFCTWGWATWKERWEDYDPDLQNIVDECERQSFDIEACGQDLGLLCKSSKFLKGQVDIWSLPWTLYHYLSSTYCVYPRQSVIENIGFDGSGLNCKKSTHFQTYRKEKIELGHNWKQLNYYLENENIVRHFLNEHGLKAFPEP